MTGWLEHAGDLLAGGPQSQAKAKELLDRVPSMPLAMAVPYTVDMIARLRVGAEAQDRMRAFLARKKT